MLLFNYGSAKDVPLLRILLQQYTIINDNGLLYLTGCLIIAWNATIKYSVLFLLLVHFGMCSFGMFLVWEESPDLNNCAFLTLKLVLFGQCFKPKIIALIK